jgi:hypothetical protein
MMSTYLDAYNLMMTNPNVWSVTNHITFWLLIQHATVDITKDSSGQQLLIK